MDLFIESISHNVEGIARNEGKVVFIQPIDIFTQTSHIENVAVLQKK